VEIDKIQLLVNEFKQELEQMGVNTKKTLADLDALRHQMEEAIEQTQKHKLSGYTQIRLQAIQGLDGAPDVFEFAVPRGRIYMQGRLSERTSYGFQIDARGSRTAGDPPVQVLEAYANINDFPFLGQKMRVGQMRLPFGYELVEPDEERLAPERSTVMNYLFPNFSEYDRGGMLLGTTTGGAQWKCGIFNGSGIQSGDDDQKKVLVGTVTKALGNMKMGAAAHFGSVASQNKNLFDVYAERRLLWFNARSEMVIGKAFGNSVFGWYGQGWRNMGTDKTVAVKLDYLKATGSPKVWTLGGGLLWQFDPATRFRVWYDLVARPGGDRATAEVQVAF
jgi:hypothetical protein